jgi:hypothetical protein
MKKKDTSLLIIALVLTFFLIGAIIFYVTSKFYWGLLWFCYPALTLIIFGILLKKSDVVSIQLLIVLIPDLFWIIDFIILLLTGKPFLGVTDYFFMSSPLIRKILTIQHVFTVPLSIWALAIMKAKIKPRLIFFCICEIIGILFISYLVPSDYGINCFPNPSSCTFFQFPSGFPFGLTWITIEVSFILISYLMLHFFLNKNNR